MVHDIFLVIAGFIAGVMNAIAGGGTLVAFPIMLAVGMPPLIANATNNLAVLPGNIGACFSYRRYLRKVPRIYLLLIVPVSFGAAIGAILLRHTSFKDFDSFIPILILFAVVLFAFQPFLYNRLQHHLKNRHKKKTSSNRKSLLIISLAIIPFAIYGGYFGAGLGFIMLAFLGFTKLHDHIHRINALKCWLTICTSLVSLILLANSHLINWNEGAIMAGGNLVGGLFGAHISQKVSSHSLRIIVIVIGISTATYLFFRSY
jgi:uncharacterized membrane protein YfcA